MRDELVFPPNGHATLMHAHSPCVVRYQGQQAHPTGTAPPVLDSGTTGAHLKLQSSLPPALAPLAPDEEPP